MDTKKKKYYTLEKRFKSWLTQIDKMHLETYRHEEIILRFYTEIFLECCDFSGLEIVLNKQNRSYVLDEHGFKLDEDKYPSICRIVKEKEQLRRKNYMEASIIPESGLPIEEVLKLGVYEFFDYCRHADSIAEIDIRNYLEIHTNGFKPDLVQAIWRDFHPYYEAERADFYSDWHKVQEAIESRKKNGVKIPLIPDKEYIPPQKKPHVSEEQYNKLVTMFKQLHDSNRGQIDVKKLLSVTQGIELWNLGIINSVLKEKINSITDEGGEPISQIENRQKLSATAIRYLFTELRNKAIIIPTISDTQLSGIISELTGYSAEQIRKKTNMTDKSKKNLKDFLISIVDKL